MVSISASDTVRPPRKGYSTTELEFLEDINALVSQTFEEHDDPWAALRTLANASASWREAAVPQSGN
jgi:hypothetical protein